MIETTLHLSIICLQVGRKIEDTNKSGHPYKLRCLTLSDINENIITCKLWGKFTDIELEKNSTWQFQCMEVDNRNNQPQVQSTDLTQLHRVDDHPEDSTKETEIEIIAVDKE